MASASFPRIVFVGGGSYSWGPTILSDVMQTPELEGAEIRLLDIDLKAAKEIKAAAESMAARLGRRFTVTATTSEARAFRGADFVLITISTGGLDTMQCDLSVPEAYGVFQTVGDTVGPGGWSRSLRNIPVFAHLARQIEKYAPGAVVLNYTNPLATLTGVLSTCSRLRTVGLCHGLFGSYSLLQQLFDVQEEDLCVRFGGVNHFFWILDFTVKGQDGYALLRKRLQGKSIDAALPKGDADPLGFHTRHALVDEFYREFGYLCYAGDRHTCEFVPGLLTPDEERLRRFRLVRTSVEERWELRRKAREVALDLAAGRRDVFPRSRETAVDIIKAVLTGTPFIDVVNLPNRGQIDNLPRETVVETLGRVDPLGFHPLTVGPLPPVLHPLVAPHCDVQLMSLEAGLTGDRELALRALMCDPLCAHLAPSDVRRMGLELMDATREYLPQFE